MRRGKKKGSGWLWTLIFTGALLLLVTSVFIADDYIYPRFTQTQYEAKTIWRDDISYFPRQDICVYLLMGIDRSGPVVDSGSYKNSGAADVIMLFVFDETKKEYSILLLNRDTMVQMPILGLGGKQAGYTKAQLALSHTYGNGLHESCENTRKTVSDLFYGIYIDQYISLNMDIISVLTNAVGGVPVTVKDDFSSIDPSITKGDILLNGDQAYTYIRTRKGVEDQLNTARMNRHVDFMEGFIDAFRTNIGNDVSKSMSIYQEITPYIVTDCSDHMVAELMSRFYEYEFNEIVLPEGSNVRGAEYMEFYLDDEKLDDLIIKLLYSPKNR